ncbi:unnamed protein product [Camellia sinensis]
MYQIGEVIGHGAYSAVHKGVDLTTNQTVAIKRTYDFDPKDGVPHTTMREISLLQQMKHDNIDLVNRFLEVVSDINNNCYIICEHLDLDLKAFMDTYPDSMDPRIIKKFLHQILSGVAYCHKKRIMHRDLKPSNLLLDLYASVVKIADFGLAREFHNPLREYTPRVVTLWYRPPEILLGSSVYFAPVDMWSVGCIFAEMVMRRPLFAGETELDHLHQIFSIMGAPNERTWPGVTLLPYYHRTNFRSCNPKNLFEVVPDLEPAGVYLLSEMLCMDPARRISAPRALEHAYFKEEEEEADEEEEAKEEEEEDYDNYDDFP